MRAPRPPPSGFETTLGTLPEGVLLLPASRGRDFDVILLFVRNLATLEAKLAPTISKMAPPTALWICWPKKTSPLAADVDENQVRKRGLAAGVVDIKVCAVDEDWSGHKFVFPAEGLSRVNTRRRKRERRNEIPVPIPILL